MKTRISAFAALALTALFTASCDSGPPARVETAIPAWAQELDVERVSKRRTRMTNDNGQDFTIRRAPQDIGDGLTAHTRGKYKLYVTDENSVQCLWRRAEKVVRCTAPNPALQPQLQ